MALNLVFYLFLPMWKPPNLVFRHRHLRLHFVHWLTAIKFIWWAAICILLYFLFSFWAWNSNNLNTYIFASSLRATRSDIPWSVSMLLTSPQNASPLDGSSGWSFCSSCSSYGYSCSRFCRIFLTVGYAFFNFDWPSAQISWGSEWVSCTLSTVSWVTLGLPARPFPSWQMHLL